jgi:hypothetical protein
VYLTKSLKKSIRSASESDESAGSIVFNQEAENLKEINYDL